MAQVAPQKIDPPPEIKQTSAEVKDVQVEQKEQVEKIVVEHKTPVHQIAESQPIRETEDNDNSQNTGNPQRKRRRRKHKKVKHHHRDPQQIKEIKHERLNVKREGQWDSRFINETIPEMFPNRIRKKKSEPPIRRNKSPLQTVYLDKDLVKHKLPQLDTKNHDKEGEGKTQKSFNIRTVGGKKHHKKGKRIFARSQKSQDGKQTINNMIKIEQKSDKAKDKNKQSSDELKAKLQQRSKIYPINQHYKQILLDLISFYAIKKSKELKILIQSEINSIGKPKNTYSLIEKMIKQRRNQLTTIKQTGENTTLGTYLTFQLNSVSLIEEILKFKAKWEEQYHKLDKPTKIDYFFQENNYFPTMKTEVQEFSEDASDPFLVSRTNHLQKLVGDTMKEQEEKQRRQMLLKIRACELLLIEQELSG